MKRVPRVLPWIIAVVGCSGPPVGAVRDGGAAETAVDAGDPDVGAVDVPDVPGVVDAGAPDVAATDVPDVPELVDSGGPDTVVADTPGMLDATAPDVVDAAVPDAGAVDAGPITMRFEFVSGTPAGEAAGLSMRSVIVWHGNHRGSAGGLSYEGWFQ